MLATQQMLTRLVAAALLLVGALPGGAAAQESARDPASWFNGHRQYRPGTWAELADLPAAGLRARIEQLPPESLGRAVTRLKRVHVPEQDLLGDSLRVDRAGLLYYVDAFSADTIANLTYSAVAVADTKVPVVPFPVALMFSSRPGAPNTLYLDFDGESVSGSAWNTEYLRAIMPALPFSLDADATTFNDTERHYIRHIWQRVAEDYAPFDVNVTTARTGPPTSRTVQIVITSRFDANGQLNPGAGEGGGIAHLDSWGDASNYAWCYADALGSDGAIGDCASHEAGHTLGLTHDGLVAAGPYSGSEYYWGHGVGEISWAPIMGAAYYRNVSQWSKGGYYRANNAQDDLLEIAQRVGYRGDDHGNVPAAPTPLVVTGGYVTSTTPESDPDDGQPANKGVMQGHGDPADVFSFAWSGPITLIVRPWRMPASSTLGGNLDVAAEIVNASGVTVASSNPPDRTDTRIQTVLAPGSYYLVVRHSGTGDPLWPDPDGYTAYGSIGQYFIVTDIDGDGKDDATDNCIRESNPGQLDADGDGYGNLCDADLNGSGLVTAVDFNLFRSVINQLSTASTLAAAADMNGSGMVTITDYNMLRARLNTAPGPSALAP